MAGPETGAERTEQPTPQRREKARKEGQVPFSQEAGIAAALLMFALALAWVLPASAAKAVAYFERGLQITLDQTLDAESSAQVVREAAWAISSMVGPVAALVVAGTLLVGVAQTGFKLQTDHMGFKPERLDPRKWLKRLTSVELPVNLGKSLLKGLGVIVLAVWSVRSFPEAWFLLPYAPVAQGAAELQNIASTVVVRVAGVMVVVALLDVAWTRYRFEEKLKMTRQEVKDDMKEADGNPHVKAAMRRRAQERAQNRLADQVASATVVAVNPTHYAVALRYRRGVDATPVVVAKGVDFRAARIRELAGRFEVPIIEDKPLARALHALVDEGKSVPLELYKPVAKLLAIVYRRKPEEWKS